MMATKPEELPPRETRKCQKEPFKSRFSQGSTWRNTHIGNHIQLRARRIGPATRPVTSIKAKSHFELSRRSRSKSVRSLAVARSPAGTGRSAAAGQRPSSCRPAAWPPSLPRVQSAKPRSRRGRSVSDSDRNTRRTGPGTITSPRFLY